VLSICSGDESSANVHVWLENPGKPEVESTSHSIDAHAKRCLKMCSNDDTSIKFCVGVHILNVLFKGLPFPRGCHSAFRGMYFLSHLLNDYINTTSQTPESRLTAMLNLAFRGWVQILNVLTEGAPPSEELIQRVKTLYNTKLQVKP
jgi:hypothetical protein